MKEISYSLAAANPSLAAEWHPFKNGILLSDMVSSKSSKKVWWKAKCGHEWKRAVKNFVKNQKCPICEGRQVLSGFNDLNTLFPSLANEWNYEKNGLLLPTMFSKASGKKVWWKCKNQHEWIARIADRTQGSSCRRDAIFSS